MNASRAASRGPFAWLVKLYTRVGSHQDRLELALAAFNAWYEEHIDPEHYDFREGIEAALPFLLAENKRLRELYENAVGNRERFGWTINHLLECEEALRGAEALLADEREAREVAEFEVERFDEVAESFRKRAEKAEAALLEARQTLVAIERHQYFIDKTLPAEVRALVRGGREPLQRMARSSLGSPEEAGR